MKPILTRFLALVGAILVAGHLGAANTLFIKFSDVKTGESLDKLFPGADGWNELADCSWSVSAETSWTKGGGASVGKPNPGTFQISRHADLSSATVLKNITTGVASATIDIVVRIQNTGATPADQTTMHYTFEGAFYTSFSQSAGPAGGVTEKIEFVYKTIKVEYRPIDPNTGKLGKSVIVTWDIPAGKVTGP